MGGKKRTIVIWHPSFEGGANGIKEAKEFAESLITGQKQMIELAEKNGEDRAVIEQTRRHINAFRVLVRKIDDDLL